MFLPPGHIRYTRWEEGNEGPSTMINLWSNMLFWALNFPWDRFWSRLSWFSNVLHGLFVLTCIEHISRDFSCMDISPHFLPCTILYTSEYKEYFFRWKKKVLFRGKRKR
jgi:hypothetical protein